MQENSIKGVNRDWRRKRFTPLRATEKQGKRIALSRLQSAALNTESELLSSLNIIVEA
jgi:hypothetical protein